MECLGWEDVCADNAGWAGADDDSRDSGRWRRPPVVCDGQRNCALRLQYERRLHALGGIWRCGRAAQPGDGYQQPSFGVAIARWAPVVCNTEGAR